MNIGTNITLVANDNATIFAVFVDCFRNRCIHAIPLIGSKTSPYPFLIKIPPILEWGSIAAEGLANEGETFTDDDDDDDDAERPNVSDSESILE
jgi:hypothetical protein